MHKHKLALAMMALTSFGFVACDDDNNSTLPALGMPGDMHVVERCRTGNTIINADEADCNAAGGAYSRMVYAVNMSTATLSYIPFYSNGAEFEVIDIATSVPGVTSIPVGERPQSVSGDDLGAFVVLTSSIHNDLSIISVNDNREIAYQELDKVPKKITYISSDDAFYVFFLDGTVRKLKLTFDCGQGQGVLTADCVLTKDKINVVWESAGSLDGTIAGFVSHPTLPMGYVSYLDRRYVSVIGYNSESGTCLDGSDKYPCEINRLGAGFGCSDGIDNNDDGLIDSEDPTCFYPWSVEGTDVSKEQSGWIGIGACNDGIDNDGDGFVDALDPGCTASNDASEEDGFQPMTLGTCGDGTDNDGDGDADREDSSCQWPINDESKDSGLSAYTAGLCRDGIDNDGDGKVDTDDLACYGKNGFSEVSLASEGRGALGIDPQGRWLYVLDPADSQLIVIDLETKMTLDRSGWFPRNRVVGIPVSRLALDVVGDVRQETVYDKNGHTVVADRAVAFVSSTSGSVIELLIHQKLTHLKDNVVQDEAEELALRPTDLDDSSSYVGIVRCVGRICAEQDLPKVLLRERPAISYFTKQAVVSNINPDTNRPHSVTYDSIIASETWRVTYEGPLEIEKRTDGYIANEGIFRTGIDLCALGAEPGDHLVLVNPAIKSGASCENFRNHVSSDHRLEWEIVDAGPNVLSLKTTGNEGDIDQLPTPECFGNGLEFEVRVNDQWLITSKSTFVNRRYTAGTHCIDDPRYPFGQTRFRIRPDKAEGEHDAQTAFFALDMPKNADMLVRDDAFEFTTRSGSSSLAIGVGSAPTTLKLFKTDDVHFLLISEASSNTIVIYDVDDESIDDTI
ncbi:MAG: hypothetical protein IJM59_12150 [Proteobacteria bacterium]|nr:hypothetical protein [Pseudomonadota bacterium]